MLRNTWKCIGAGHPYAIVQSEGRAEQSIDIQGEDNKERGEWAGSK